MNRWMLAVSVACAFVGLSSAGCVVERRTVVQEPQAQVDDGVEVNEAPPAEQEEVVTVAPSREHIWIRGHWQWSGRRYVWVPGHWETRRAGYEWVPGHWKRTARGYVWVSGRWARR